VLLPAHFNTLLRTQAGNDADPQRYLGEFDLTEVNL
jgi:hypothetical protein